MSSDAETTGSSDTEETHSRIEALEAHLSSDAALVSERLTAVRARLTEYEDAQSAKEQQDALNQVESELEELRDDIEQELEEGKSKAHDMVDQIETKLSNLR